MISGLGRPGGGRTRHATQPTLAGTVRFFAPTGPDVTSASCGVLMPSSLAFFTVLEFFTGPLLSFRFSFSIIRFCLRFHCMLSSPPSCCC